MLIKHLILIVHSISVFGLLLIEVSIGQRNPLSDKNYTGPYVVADLSLSQDLIENN